MAGFAQDPKGRELQTGVAGSGSVSSGEVQTSGEHVQDPLASLFIPRSAGEIVDLALRENEKAEYVIMWISASMALVGLGLLIWSGVAKNGVLAFSGVSASSLCVYALRLFWKIRTERYSLRLTELLLERARNPEEAANVLSKVVDTVFKPGLTFTGVPWLPSKRKPPRD